MLLTAILLKVALLVVMQHIGINRSRSIATVSQWLSVNPHPGSSSVAVVEVAPKIPLSSLGLSPLPQRPSLGWKSVHERQVKSRVEGGELGVVAKVPFAERISGFVTSN